MEPLWTAEAGEMYYVDATDPGWALAAWERDTTYWHVWIPIDGRIQQLSLDQPPYNGPDSWLVTFSPIQTYDLSDNLSYLTGTNEWYRVALVRGNWALAVWEYDLPTATKLVWIPLGAGVAVVSG
jgi:hypothetical protein